MADLPLWQVGLATAFSSSFAHCILIGRPGLVVAYTLGRDLETGEPYSTCGTFLSTGLQ